MQLDQPTPALLSPEFATLKGSEAEPFWSGAAMAQFEASLQEHHDWYVLGLTPRSISGGGEGGGGDGGSNGKEACEGGQREGGVIEHCFGAATLITAAASLATSGGETKQRRPRESQAERVKRLQPDNLAAAQNGAGMTPLKKAPSVIEYDTLSSGDEDGGAVGLR